MNSIGLLCLAGLVSVCSVGAEKKPCPFVRATRLPHVAHCNYAVVTDETGCPKFQVNCTGGACKDACRAHCDERCLLDADDNGTAHCIRRPNCASEVSRTSAMNKDEGMCLQPPETGPCRAYFPSFYYDWRSKKCDRFVYGGCGGNENRFETKNACETKCAGRQLTKRERCSLPGEAMKGGIRCRAAIPMVTYDKVEGECRTYIYGGCGATENLFNTKADCNVSCGGLPSCPLNSSALILPKGCRHYRTSYVNGARSFCGEQRVHCNAHAGDCPSINGAVTAPPNCAKRCTNDWLCARDEKCCGGCCKRMEFDFKFDW